ncbi:MAG TPA: YihY/virulence factor BrkB family protein [Polyangia bacterium]|nr:YihY/virulence factor BrkB family protein [Polyangia bacterium]
MSVSLRTVARDFRREIRDDHLGQGAAALAFYWMLALFPAAIFLLTLLAYLPIPHLERAVMHFARTTLPDDAGALLSSFVDTVLNRKRGGLLSFGAVLTVWSTSSGIHALMHQLNVAWDVDERRPFWRRRAVAMLIAMCFVLLIIAAFGLIVFGRALHLRLLRWVVICGALLVGIALIYHYGPNVRRRFRVVTPGSLLALAMLIVASVAFQVFVSRVASYSITYGSLGAAITLMMWLYLAAWAILLGAELDATLASYVGARS